jgi:regulator of nonsense transcripts 3
MALNEVVRTATWEDAKSTFTSPSLIAPPALEFAIYKKVPNIKKRTDARQGTIDQDPEFMAFLEGLANPASAPEAEETEDAAKTDTKVTTTPLVEYLKEKKANKGRDSGKGSKHSRQESGAGKGKGSAKDDEGSSRKKGREAKGERATKPAKENVKILTKKPAAEKTTEATDKSEPTASANGGDAPKSRRAGIAAAARLLQRDLGLSPGSAHRRARQDAAKADSDTKSSSPSDSKGDNASRTTEPVDSPTAPTELATKTPAAASPTGSTSAANATKNASGGRRNRGGRNADKSKAVDTSAAANPTPVNPPIILKKKPEPDAVPTESPKETAVAEPAATAPANKPSVKTPTAKTAGNKKVATITPGVTRGFVKHANSSQGITEPLLRGALQTFGTITSLELDKRKGFAYVEFADHEALVKASGASPVSVAQGAVQIMERKDKKPAAAPGGSGSASASVTSEKPSGGRGRRGRGGGGGGKNSAAAKDGGQQTAASVTASGG